jgi:hypothetical protein
MLAPACALTTCTPYRRFEPGVPPVPVSCVWWHDREGFGAANATAASERLWHTHTRQPVVASCRVPSTHTHALSPVDLLLCCQLDLDIDAVECTQFICLCVNASNTTLPVRFSIRCPVRHCMPLIAQWVGDQLPRISRAPRSVVPEGR